jgi:hypothetical protein
LRAKAKQSSFVASIMDCFVASLLAMTETDLPDGQISAALMNFPVQPHLKKYFA